MTSNLSLNSTVLDLPDCSDIWVEILTFLKIFQTLAFLGIVISSVFGNFVVLKTIIMDRDMRKVYCNIFIVNLALCDILQATVGMPPMASVLIFDKKWLLTPPIFPDIPCKLARAINKIVPAVASYTNVVIAIDRLVGVLRPFREKMPRSYALGLMGVTWLVCCSSGVFDFLTSTVVSYPDVSGQCLVSYCYQNTTPKQFTIDIIVYSMAIFLLPSVVVSIVYGRTAVELWMRSGVQSGDNAARQQLGESISARQIAIKRRAVKMMTLVVLVFDLSRMPLFAIYWAYLINQGPIPFQEHITLGASWLYCTSTVCNPVIYAVMNEKFRGQFKATLSCKKQVQNKYSCTSAYKAALHGQHMQTTKTRNRNSLSSNVNIASVARTIPTCNMSTIDERVETNNDVIGKAAANQRQSSASAKQSHIDRLEGVDFVEQHDWPAEDMSDATNGHLLEQNETNL